MTWGKIFIKPVLTQEKQKGRQRKIAFFQDECDGTIPHAKRVLKFWMCLFSMTCSTFVIPVLSPDFCIQKWVFLFWVLALCDVEIFLVAYPCHEKGIKKGKFDEFCYLNAVQLPFKIKVPVELTLYIMKNSKI